jgi:hypothetical protein
VAKLDKNNRNVTFLHRSYAEHLVARVFFQQILSGTQDRTLILLIKQLKSILLDEGNSEIRKHICGIIASAPQKILKFDLEVLKIEEKKLIELIFREDLYELYQVLKEHHLRCAHENFILVNEGEHINLLYLALRNARRAFVENVINDGAKIENTLQ